jgi:hypothetical protein
MNEALVLIPYGRHERVFPWGPSFVRDYAERHVPGARVGLVDLSLDPSINDALKWQRFPRLDRLIARLRGRLPPGASKDHLPTGPFYLPPDGTDAHYVAGLLLLADEEFLSSLSSLAGEPRAGADLRRQHAEYADRFSEALRASLAGQIDPARPLFGVSHSGRVITSALSIAYVLRRLHPQSTIVLGGPQITPDLGRTLTRIDSGLDAVVVGFGEKPFASLLGEVRARGHIEGVDLPFVITRSSANVPGASGDERDHEYRFEAAAGPYADPELDSARVDERGVLHILPIRGCRWGACTFCADAFALKRFRAPVIETAQSKLAQDIERAVEKWVGSDDAQARLCIDAAEVYGDEAIQILGVVDRKLRALGHRFADGVSVFFYLPARKFDLAMARAFRAFSDGAWQSFLIEPTIAIESLNEVSLKRIRKGIEPLQAIASLKAALDMGWSSVLAQYFVFYPGEEDAAVRDEVALMKRSLHLLASERLYLNVIHYPIVLKEGELYNRAAEYGLATRSTPDPLLSLRYRRDVTSGGSIWASQYQLDEREPRNRASRSFFELVAAYWWVRYRLDSLGGAPWPARQGQRIFWGGYLLSKGLRFAAGSLLRGGAMAQRAAIALWCERRGSRWHWQGRNPGGKHPTCIIRDGRLERDYPFPGPRAQSIALAPDQLRLLRAIYFPTRLSELPAELRALVDEQVALGTVIRRGEMAVSVVNDPEHLAATARVAQEPLVQLRPLGGAQPGT